MIKNNIDIFEERLSAKCKECGRDRDDIKLIAVSKYNPVSVISEAFENGMIHFGENRAQEFCDKAEIVKEPITWHYIGHLQSNKAKNVVKFADFIHSVDTLKLAKEINKRAVSIDKVQKVLLEVNTGGEENKYGLESESDIFELAEFCKNSSNIELVGLMTMAPFTDDTNIVKDCFVKLRKFKESLNNQGFKLTELSMGMTNDWEVAVEEGSTILRVGTAIFGERDYSKKWNEK